MLTGQPLERPRRCVSVTSRGVQRPALHVAQTEYAGAESNRAGIPASLPARASACVVLTFHCQAESDIAARRAPVGSCQGAPPLLLHIDLSVCQFVRRLVRIAIQL